MPSPTDPTPNPHPSEDPLSQPDRRRRSSFPPPSSAFEESLLESDESFASLRVDLEHETLTRQEYISAMVHFYRGEMDRATSWRLRLDNTTNWAIVSSAGLLSFSFGQKESDNHVTLILGQLLLFFFLWVEARRYRFFDVWRSRVRKIEENFINPLLTRRLTSPDPLWADAVAMDLSRPKFKMSRWHAVHQRLLSNYLVLFVIMLVSWLTKVSFHPKRVSSVDEWLDHMRIGAAPWWMTVVLLIAFYGLLGAYVIIPGSATRISGRQWGLGEEDVEEQ